MGLLEQRRKMFSIAMALLPLSPPYSIYKIFYFITQINYERDPWLCSDIGRKSLRAAISQVRLKYPFCDRLESQSFLLRQFSNSQLKQAIAALSPCFNLQSPQPTLPLTPQIPGQFSEWPRHRPLPSPSNEHRSSLLYKAPQSVQ